MGLTVASSGTAKRQNDHHTLEVAEQSVLEDTSKEVVVVAAGTFNRRKGVNHHCDCWEVRQQLRSRGYKMSSKPGVGKMLLLAPVTSKFILLL